MNEGTPRSLMAESNGPERRRSARLSSPQTNVKVDKMAPSATVKRSITVKKIAPRKTVVPSEHNKENMQRVSEGGELKKAKISTPGPVQVPPVPSSKKAAMPSPILASPPRPPPAPQPAADPEDSVWSQKVRRSYSRLSDQSMDSPDRRETLFGFEKLQTPEVGRRVGQSKTGLEVSGSLSGLNSFTSLLEAEDCAASFPEPDLNIPGVAVVKEKRRRKKKVQQINITELDALAAKMNAEFDEAEGFDLVVE
ncbi:sororin [Centroberyx gerrardi]|uniref:sororin n=1 Tax=Centroberyx gerrardi TaxID=166262 RepID=UPI003AABD1FC